MPDTHEMFKGFIDEIQRNVGACLLSRNTSPAATCFESSNKEGHPVAVTVRVKPGSNGGTAVISTSVINQDATPDTDLAIGLMELLRKRQLCAMPGRLEDDGSVTFISSVRLV